VILQFHAQVSDVAIHHIAPRYVVGTPQRVEDLLAPERLARVGREQVQESLLHRGQLRMGFADLHPLIEEVDLQPGDFDHRDESDIVAVAPPHQGQRPCDELLGHERHRDDVVRASIEGGELCLEIASHAEHDRRNASARHSLADQAESLSVVGVEIYEQKMRPPLFEVGPRALRALGDMRDVLAMIESQSNEVREWLIDNDQDSRRAQELVLLYFASLPAG
jgi:hypothetical protein